MTINYRRVRGILADPAHLTTPAMPERSDMTPTEGRMKLEADRANLAARLTAADTLLAKIRALTLNDGTNSISDPDRYAAVLTEQAVAAGAEPAAARAAARRVITNYTIAQARLAEAVGRLAIANEAIRTLNDLAAEKG